MSCEKCLYKDFYLRLSEKYEITALDSRTRFIEINQYDSKGKEVMISSIIIPNKRK